MGPSVEMSDVQEAIHLNRLLRLYPPDAEGGERWELEADPRHVEILVSQMGLSNESKAVSTPGARTTDEEDGKELGAEDRACYRSCVDDAGQLSQSRQMWSAVRSEGTCETDAAAEHQEHASPQTSGAIPKGKPEMLGRVQQTSWTANRGRLLRQRLGRVCEDPTYVMLGGHLLAASATTQKVAATSSGEAEFYALTKSASRALGAVAMAADMAKVVKPRVRVDATA